MECPKCHFKNEEHATRVVRDIEDIVDKKFEDSRNSLSTKEDIMLLKQDIMQFKQDLLNLALRLQKQMNSQFTWLIGTIIAAVGLAVAIIKL